MTDKRESQRYRKEYYKDSKEKEEIDPYTMKSQMKIEECRLKNKSIMSLNIASLKDYKTQDLISNNTVNKNHIKTAANYINNKTHKTHADNIANKKPKNIANNQQNSINLTNPPAPNFQYKNLKSKKTL